MWLRSLRHTDAQLFDAGKLVHAAAPLRMARKAFTICGMMRTNSAVVLITSINAVPIYGKLVALYGCQPH